MGKTNVALANDLIDSCKAVLFDFDGIIIDSEWPIYESWLRVFEGEGHTLKSDTYAQCIGSDFDTWSPEKYLESLTHKSYDWDTINAKRQVELEADLEDADTLPGVRELILKLKSTGKQIAVVSSSSHNWVDKWLDRLGLTSQMTEIVCRGDAPKIKPAPDLYLEAVKRLNLDASECLVIEDSLNGTKAGLSAQCPVIAIPSRLTSCFDFELASAEVNSMQDLV